MYEIRKFCYARLDFFEALEEVRRYYIPSILDRPDDILYAKIEFDMRASKNVRVLLNFVF